MKAWGASAEQIAQWQSASSSQEEKQFAVWPENWPAVKLFISLSTQWRLAANGLPYGLDYPGVWAFLRLSGQRMAPETFAAIQTMEQAAIGVFQAQRSRRGK